MSLRPEFSDFADATITITRPADRDGLGRDQGDTAEPVYDGAADVQEQEVRKASGEGGVTRVGDARAFLDGSAADVQAGDEATVTRPDGSTFEATVASVKRLDDSIVLSKDR